MTPELTELVTLHLSHEEGFVPHVYDDHLGYATIGIGRLVDKRKGGGITEEEAHLLLANDLERIESKLNDRLPWWTNLSTTRQTVLLSMAFQMGIAGLMKFNRTLEHIRLGRWELAARHMQLSRWARQTPGRAARLAHAMSADDDTHLRTK